MFNKAIEQTKFTDDVASGLFSRIHGDHYEYDISFLATLRILLNNRSGDDNISLAISGSNYGAYEIERAMPNDVFRATANVDHYDMNTIIIHNLRGAGNAAVMEKFDAAFCDKKPMFRELKDLRQFVAQYMNARFYIAESARKMLILVDEMNYRRFHLLQSMIPRYFPWYFTDNPITDDEKRLIKSLTHRYATEYEQIVREFASRIDFRSHAIRNILGSYERNARSEQLRRVENELENNRIQIDRNVSSYTALIQQRDDLNLRYAGIQSIINGATDDSELIEYFTCNRNLIPVSTHGMAFSFIVKCYLDSFDPDMYETMSRNPHSHLYRDYRAPAEFSSMEDKKLFLDAIFSDDPKLKVKVCAYYSLDARGVADTMSGYDYPDECSDRIPNPHLHYHHCLGNHKRYIEDCIRNGDMIRAVEQCVSSAKSLNIGEGVTACRFIGDLMSARNNIFELPDGTSVNGVQALKWLKEQNA